MNALKQHRNTLVLGKQAPLEALSAKHVPYTHHVDEHTIATRNGHYLQTLKIDGFSFETADQMDINARKEMRATMLRGLSSSRFALYHHIIRREVDQYPEGVFENDFCDQLDKAYRQRIADRRMFINEQYLTIVRRPAQNAVGRIENMMRAFRSSLDADAIAEQQQEDLKSLNDAVSKVASNLQRYGVKRLGITEAPTGEKLSEPLSFLGFLINHEMRPYRLPRASIQNFLAFKRISIGRETIELRGSAPNDVKITAMASIANYDPSTEPGMLDDLLRLPTGLVMTQTFSFMDRAASLSRMKLTRRQYNSAEEDSKTLLDELDNAIDDVGSGRSAYGLHHMSVAPICANPAQLDKALNDIDTVMSTRGIITKREDMNAEATFWAQLPGNQSYIARGCPISTDNFASFASLHTFPSGKLHGNWWGPPITLLETTSGSPFWFSFHDRDVGNFTMIGPTGAGKTVLASFLIAQAQRVNPITFLFDKDRGTEIFVRAMGGKYTVVKPGSPSGFNPLQMADTPENRSFLRTWLGLLLAQGQNHALNAEEEAVVSDAIRANYELPPSSRNMTEIAPLLGGFETPGSESLSARFSKWHGTGDHAWLFDNEDDTLKLDARVMGFDMTSILDDPTCRTPYLLYVFHRINQVLRGLGDDGEIRKDRHGNVKQDKVMILLDEAWKLIEDDLFAKEVLALEKTIRKMNGLLGLMTQSPEDVLKSKVGTAIVEQSPTNIFLPNPRADQASYMEGFNLSYQEYLVIRELGIESRSFLVRHGKDSVVAKLDLSGLDEYLAVLSGRTETVNLMTELRERYGSEPSQWLPHFMERMKK